MIGNIRLETIRCGICDLECDWHMDDNKVIHVHCPKHGGVQRIGIQFYYLDMDERKTTEHPRTEVGGNYWTKCDGKVASCPHPNGPFLEDEEKPT